MKSAAALGCGAPPGPSCFNLQPCPHQNCISPAAPAGFRAPSFLMAPAHPVVGRRSVLRPISKGRTQREVTRVGGGGPQSARTLASLINSERGTQTGSSTIFQNKKGGGWNRQSAVVLNDLGHDTQELPSYRLCCSPGPPPHQTHGLRSERRSVLNIRAAQPPQQQFI